MKTNIPQQPPTVPKDPKRIAAGKLGGRPATRRESNRDQNVQFRLSAVERDTLIKYTRSLGTNMNSFMVEVLSHIIAPHPDSQEGVPIMICGKPYLLEKQEAKRILKDLTEKLLN